MISYQKIYQPAVPLVHYGSAVRPAARKGAFERCRCRRRTQGHLRGRTGTGHEVAARPERALKADIDADAWESLHRTESRPFDKPQTGRIAVKVINDYGDEVMKVFSL
jgi:hypothetical protein